MSNDHRVLPAVRRAQPAHLAQFNYARARHAPDDPRMAGFVGGLEEINRLADSSPGFLWRLQTESGHSIDIRPFPEDDLKLITLSTWRDIESLRAFVYRGQHASFLRRSHDWFEPSRDPYLVLWWRDRQAPPTVEEGLAKLAHLREHGPSFEAFDMRNIYGRDGSPIAPVPSQGAQ